MQQLARRWVVRKKIDSSERMIFRLFPQRVSRKRIDTRGCRVAYSYPVVGDDTINSLALWQ